MLHEPLGLENYFVLLVAANINGYLMEFGKRTGQVAASLILLVVLLLPMAVQCFHTLEGHGHVPCDENSVHFHEKADDCHICDFHFAPFTYDIAEFPEWASPEIPTGIEKHFYFLQLSSFLEDNTRLRAPPSFWV
ncbi:MAG: hypothetical protein AB3N16_02955 [Flavobacteriaceae bacterium]